MNQTRRSHALGRRILTLLLSALLALSPAATSVAQAAGTTNAAAGATNTAAAATMTVSFLDVGQGDAAVIQCGGQTLMIDGGPSKRSDYVYSWLKQRGITTIDYMIATHTDADHIGGLSGALNAASVGAAYCSSATGTTRTFNSYVKYLTRQGKGITVPSVGTCFALGNAVVQILGPIGTSTDSNNNSIVAKVTFGNTSFLFTGDAEREEEQALLNSGVDLSSTVIKIGHHGSASSTSYQFLREVNPQYAVISVGADNSYGHPTADVLSRLRDADVKTYRTDMQGEIVMVSDGQTVAVATARNADADTLAGAGAGQKSSPSTGNAGSGAAAGAGAGAAIAGSGAATGSGAASSAGVAAGSGSQNAAPVAQNTYVLNTNTHKFHYQSCGNVKQMKDKNKQVVTSSRDSIIAQGYDPCKRCNP